MATPHKFSRYGECSCGAYAVENMPGDRFYFIVPGHVARVDEDGDLTPAKEVMLQLEYEIRELETKDFDGCTNRYGAAELIRVSEVTRKETK